MTGPAVERHARPSAAFDAKLEHTRDLIVSCAQSHPNAALACSLGAEDMVLVDLVARHAPQLDIFVLDTGALHEQTLTLLTELLARPGLRVQVYRPRAGAAEAFVQQHGGDAMYRSTDLRHACCAVRKLEPLRRALTGRTAWLTGLRREQSSARAEVPEIDDAGVAATGRLKFNPLADWTWGDVWHYIERYVVPYNPLHDAFFPSIGCAPCTRAISLGEDFRAGRWWWEQSATKECGLHVSPATSPLRPTANL